MYILRKYFSNKKEKVKPHTKEWYDGGETNNQQSNRKKTSATIGAITGLGIAGLGKEIADADAKAQGEFAELEAVKNNSTKIKKLQDIENELKKSLDKRGVISEDLANLQRKEIARKMGIENPSKLLEEVESNVKKIQSGEIAKEVGRKLKRSRAKKVIPAAAIVGTGIGLGYNSLVKSNNEKNNRVRREKLQKNYSDSKTKDPAVIGSGLALGTATGIGGAKLLETTGGNLAAKVLSLKKRQELKKDVKEIEKGVETQIKKVKDLGLKGKDLENAISDIKKRSGLRIDAKKLINGQEIQNIEKGAKLGFKNGKFMRNAKVAIPIGTALATVPVTSKLVKNANKKKEK